MTRRVILLLLAILIAVAGAVAVYLYVQSIEDQVAEGQEQVQVLVATQTIPFGQTAGQAEAAGSLELATIAAESAAPGVLSSIEPIRDLTALAPIYAGEQILEQKFGTPGSTSALPIPEGLLALSLQLSDPARVAGFVGPGSEVAIFVTAAPPTEADAPEGVGVELFTTVLIPRIEVIAAGQTTVISRTTTGEGGEQTTEQIPLAILTLAANQQQAQEIIQAQSQGSLYFGLLTDTSVTQVGPATRFQDLVTE
jgi:pilus assembly protein CpaB